jgi:hypothetical protein
MQKVDAVTDGASALRWAEGKHGSCVVGASWALLGTVQTGPFLRALWPLTPVLRERLSLPELHGHMWPPLGLVLGLWPLGSGFRLFKLPVPPLSLCWRLLGLPPAGSHLGLGLRPT